MTSVNYIGAHSNLITLRKLNTSVVQISPLASDSILNEQKLNQEYLTLAASYQEYHLSGPSLLVKNFNWKKIIVFSSENYLVVYDGITNLIKTSGEQIVNPKELAIFPTNYSKNDFEKYKEFFLFARRSKCKIFIIASNNNGLILEGLYDVGYRKGEFVSIWFHFTYSLLLTTKVEDSVLKKYKELLPGNLVGSYLEWNGKKGKTIKKTLEKSNSDPTFMCISYDTFSAIHNSVEHLISIGEDYEDQDILNQQIRKQRFEGCLGSVYFTPGYNHRSGVFYMFKQVVLNETTNELELMDLVITNRYALRTTIFLNQPRWSETS